MKTGYDIVADMIEEKYGKLSTGKYAVTIQKEYEDWTSLEEFEVCDKYWVWKNDWWEGEKEIKIFSLYKEM